ncbi:MAG TPA: xanthine dehydrogenase family protein molybdopterin-binding subunit, partial [Chloroflexota bacterium]
LIRGQGRYVDDLAPSDALHGAFLRSPFANAAIRRIATEAALAAPEVVAVLTGRDLPGPSAPGPGGPAAGPPASASGRSGYVAASAPPPVGAVRESTQTAPGGPDFLAAPQPILALDAARHVGVPVALVIAQTPAKAADALALIEVDWETAAAVSDVEAAARPDAPLVHPGLGTNLAFTARKGTPSEEIEPLLAGAAHRLRRRLGINRLAGVPIQPMTIVATPEPTGDGLTIWSTTQAPWRVRAAVARALGLPETAVRSVAPDVGGGFGVRGPVYSEYLAVAQAAHRLGRAVRWSASRSEDMLATRCARDVVADAELAADAQGNILAIRARVLQNLGAYADSPGTGRRILDCLAGAYRAPAVAVELVGVYTNTTPTGAYRGAGRPEAAYIVERLVDALAIEAGFDPVELRCRNFIPPERFPYTTPTGAVYDSGDYEPALRRALELVDYAGWRARQAEALRAGGRLIGIGIASYIEPTASGWESGLVRVEPSGRVVAFSGSHSQGQGHPTAFAQIVADRLAVPFEAVTVRQGDTASGPPGIGTFGSRSTTLGGNALHVSAGKVLEKARQIAAHLLEAAPADVQVAGGAFAVAGAPSRQLSWQRVAQAAYGGALPPGMEPGLEATTYFSVATDPFSFGSCVAVVQIEPETGQIAIERLVSVDDCGNVVNPRLLEGQSHGGLAQGIGAALFEWVQYDRDGQVLTGTLMDYAVPRATDLPRFELDHTVTPSPWSPLGVKGHGESGTIAAPPAVINAAIDALTPLGITALEPPLTPERIWAAIRRRASSAG